MPDSPPSAAITSSNRIRSRLHRPPHRGGSRAPFCRSGEAAKPRTSEAPSGGAEGGKWNPPLRNRTSEVTKSTAAGQYEPTHRHSHSPVSNPRCGRGSASQKPSAVPNSEPTRAARSTRIISQIPFSPSPGIVSASSPVRCMDAAFSGRSVMEVSQPGG